MIVRDVGPITEQQLQRVLSLGKRDRGLRLSLAEVNVLRVGRYGFVEGAALEGGIDDEMVVPRIRCLIPCGRDGHAGQSEFDQDGRCDGVTVFNIDEGHFGVRGRRRFAGVGCGDTR